MWFEWIKRERDGGLRVMVALATNNKTLADAVQGPGDDLPTNDKASADLQIQARPSLAIFGSGPNRISEKCPRLPSGE